jgi:septal ring factor EnvC (AmiA/AmiB activator)
MFSTKTPARLRARLAAAFLLAAVGLAAPAQAAKLGPYFPIPNGFNLNGIAKDALLSIQASWLQNGLDNLEKAKKETGEALEKARAGAQDQVAALEKKLEEIDKTIADTKAEIALANDTTASNELQHDRKDKLLANVNQWINELEKMATQQMKVAIMSDGAEAMTAQKLNYQYSQFADDLQKAKRDPSVENWGK